MGRKIGTAPKGYLNFREIVRIVKEATGCRKVTAPAVLNWLEHNPEIKRKMRGAVWVDKNTEQNWHDDNSRCLSNAKAKRYIALLIEWRGAIVKRNEADRKKANVKRTIERPKATAKKQTIKPKKPIKAPRLGPLTVNVVFQKQPNGFHRPVPPVELPKPFYRASKQRPRINIRPGSNTVQIWLKAPRTDRVFVTVNGLKLAFKPTLETPNMREYKYVTRPLKAPELTQILK